MNNKLKISKEEIYNLLRFGKTSGKCIFECVEFDEHGDWDDSYWVDEIEVEE